MSRPETPGTTGFRLFGLGTPFGVRPVPLLQCYLVRDFNARWALFNESLLRGTLPRVTDSVTEAVRAIREVDPNDRFQGFVDAGVIGFPGFLAWMSPSYAQAHPRQFVGYGPRTPGFPFN